MRWLALIAVLVFAACGGEDAAPSKRAAKNGCTPPSGDADAAARARMAPGMELERTKVTLAAGRGERMLVTGAVIRDCEPVAGTTLTAWQANAKGLYGPRRNSCCYLTATVTTDSRGRYALDTIVPAAYVGGGEPHIHMEVENSGILDVVIEGRPERMKYDVVLP
jgi:protocatechuate 3,4-dioxygenase beta subunit